MKKALAICAAVAVLLAAILVIVPAFVDLGAYKNTYLPLIEESLGRKIDVTTVRLSLIPAPSIRLANLKISDGPAFPNNTFFAAEQLQLRLKVWPLLRGRFEVSEFILDKPVINLLKRADGTFNYADLAGKKLPMIKKPERKPRTAQAKPVEAPMIPLVLPVRMRIKDGALNLQTQGQKPVNIRGIDLALQKFSADHPFPYSASFDYPGLKQVSLEGQLSYREDNGTLTVTNNRVKALDLALPLEGTVSNLTSTPQVSLTSISDQVDAKPVFDVLSVFGLAPKETEISGPMQIHLSISGPSNHLVSEIHGKFIDVKVNGKRALKGNLTGDVTLKLPFGPGPTSRRISGNGQLTARNGELTNVNLVKRVQRVTGMMGLNKEQGREATTFQTLQADFTIGGGNAEFKRLYLVNPQMEVNGSGTMTIEQPTLDMGLETTVPVAPLNRLGKNPAVAIFKTVQGRAVVPLKVTGPLEHPSVNLDLAKVVEKGTLPSLDKRMGSFFRQLFK